MNKKIKKYCSITPQFPKEGFIPFLRVTTEESIVAYLPLYLLCTSLADIQTSVEKIADEITEAPLTLEETALFLPVVFGGLVPLKRAYWENESVLYSNESRMRLFLSALSNFPMYNVLITPWKLKRSVHEFAAAIPLYKSADQKNVEKFMLHSDFPVDEKAKYAALYSFGEPFTINWTTGERLPDKLHLTVNDRH